MADRRQQPPASQTQPGSAIYPLSRELCVMKNQARVASAALAVILLVVATACTSPLAAGIATTNTAAGPTVSEAASDQSTGVRQIDRRLARLEGVSAVTSPPPSGVEPGAGSWTTWLLASGSQFRPPAPPAKQATRGEIDQLQDLASRRDAGALQQIAFWNDGGPLYRWHAIALDELLKHNMNTQMAERALALLHAATYDAVIAAWDAKYTYGRPRPSDFDHRVTTAVPNPASPSYPSEYAAVAGASS